MKREADKKVRVQRKEVQRAHEGRRKNVESLDRQRKGRKNVRHAEKETVEEQSMPSVLLVEVDITSLANTKKTKNP